LLAVAGIRVYQKHISPRKGFSCAHRVRHGGVSCSEFVRRSIVSHGMWAAIPLTRERFAQCKAAAHELREMRAARAAAFASGDWEKRKERLCDTCEIADLSCEGINCGLECGDCAGCDGSPCS
jgi:putative component of membrane protein insertase Oxa1/YidC/SpoIIIJ protein YidD